MLFEPFVWINTMSNIYFVIVFTCNAIHRMFLYFVQGLFFFFGKHIAFMDNVICNWIFLVVL